MQIINILFTDNPVFSLIVNIRHSLLPFYILLVIALSFIKESCPLILYLISKEATAFLMYVLVNFFACIFNYCNDLLILLCIAIYLNWNATYYTGIMILLQHTLI